MGTRVSVVECLSCSFSLWGPKGSCYIRAWLAGPGEDKTMASLLNKLMIKKPNPAMMKLLRIDIPECSCRGPSDFMRQSQVAGSPPARG